MNWETGRIGEHDVEGVSRGKGEKEGNSGIGLKTGRGKIGKLAEREGSRFEVRGRPGMGVIGWKKVSVIEGKVVKPKGDMLGESVGSGIGNESETWELFSEVRVEMGNLTNVEDESDKSSSEAT